MTIVSQTGSESGFNFSAFAIDVAEFDPRNGTGISHSATQFVVDFGGGLTRTYTGTGFSGFDADGIPSSGTISSIDFADTTISPASVTHLTDLSLSVATFLSLADAHDSLGFTDLIMGGADTMFGTSVADTMSGYGGNDFLSGGGGNDFLWGDDGDDNFRGGAGRDVLNGGAGFDWAWYDDATSGVQVNLLGGPLSADSFFQVEGLVGSPFNDVLIGNFVGNTLRGGAGDDTLDGTGIGDGDFADYSDAASGVMVSLAIVGPQAVGGGLGSDTLTDMEGLIGSHFNDTLTGDGNANSLVGGEGDDTLDGGVGFDVAGYGDATGGVNVNLSIAGPQAVGGGEGTDTLVGIEGLVGSTFGDVLAGDGNANSFRGGAGDDILSGGGGFDIADYSDAPSSVAVALYKQVWVLNQQDTGGAGTDTLTGIEKLVGSAFSDSLFGSVGNDPIEGQDGADVIEGYTGDDVLYGGFGDDTLYGDEGSDKLNGGWGADFLSGGADDDSLEGGNGDDILSGGAGNDVLYGGYANYTGDTTFGYGADHLFGGPGNDVIYARTGTGKIIFGDDGNDTVYFDGNGSGTAQGGDGADWIEITGFGRADIYGEDGDDSLKGGAQSDYISGGAGDDFLYGNGGADRLIGGDGGDRLSAGAGDDYLWGGAGADRFFFLDGFSAGQIDTIRDFEDGVDTIYLPSALSGAVTIGTSAYGTYVTVATAQGQIAILIEDVTPSHITLGADIQFV